MTSHDEMRLSLGSYLTGGLGPAARAEVDDHLRHCDACRAELVELAALPGLLGRLGHEQLATQPFDYSLLGAGPSRSNPAEAAFAGPRDGLLPGLLAQARGIEARSRRRLRRVRAATVAFAVAAVVAAAFAVAPTAAPVPGTSYRLRAQAVSARLAGRVTLVRKPWGHRAGAVFAGLAGRAGLRGRGDRGARATRAYWQLVGDTGSRRAGHPRQRHATVRIGIADCPHRCRGAASKRHPYQTWIVNTGQIHKPLGRGGRTHGRTPWFVGSFRKLQT